MASDISMVSLVLPRESDHGKAVKYLMEFRKFEGYSNFNITKVDARCGHGCSGYHWSELYLVDFGTITYSMLCFFF
jgi:hypothetical protein